MGSTSLRFGDGFPVGDGWKSAGRPRRAMQGQSRSRPPAPSAARPGVRSGGASRHRAWPRRSSTPPARRSPTRRLVEPAGVVLGPNPASCWIGRSRPGRGWVTATAVPAPSTHRISRRGSWCSGTRARRPGRGSTSRRGSAALAGRPVIARPGGTVAVAPRAAYRDPAGPEQDGAGRAMRAVVPAPGPTKPAEVVVRGPSREARTASGGPEAGRQLREVPPIGAARMAGVTMAAPAPAGAPARARAGGRPLVVGAVAVEVVAAGPGLFLRIVLGLIARPGELRGRSTGVARRSAAAAEAAPIGTGSTTAATNRPVAMRERKPGATTVPLPCRAVE